MTHKHLTLTEPLAAYVHAHDTSLSEGVRTLYEESAAHELGQRVSTPDTAALLALLVRTMRARRVLEIGTFTGFATLAMAEALPKDGEVVTVEKDTRFKELAARHWRAASVEERITALTTDAHEYFATLAPADTFDLIFIDADKGSYEAYYEAAMAHLTAQGLIVVDNTLWRGLVADADTHDTITTTIRAFNAHVAADRRVRATLLPLGDGLTLIEKR